LRSLEKKREKRVKAKRDIEQLLKKEWMWTSKQMIFVFYCGIRVTKQTRKTNSKPWTGSWTWSISRFETIRDEKSSKAFGIKIKRFYQEQKKRQNKSSELLLMFKQTLKDSRAKRPGPDPIKLFSALIEAALKFW